ncbi:MAG: RluA family pseudouridine synthase [Vicingaceae bacterium]|nr:RluA family pseudouridine synthase [Vicingaceae bacterium]
MRKITDLPVLKTHIVPSNTEEIRLYDYVQQIFPIIPSRKGVKKAIAREEILVDGNKTSTGHWIRAGQKIELLESSANPPKEYHLKLEIVYEDEFMAVINKPAGIPVSGNQFRTIQNALIGNIKLSKEKDAIRWPKPVHRLDGPTSGLLIIAKTAKALVRLGQQFEQKEIKKKYVAIVMGKTQERGIVDTAVDGLNSLSEYETFKTIESLKSKHLSLVELSPKTGRTHQLRIHLSSIGFPILGDKLYGDEGEILMGKGLFLAAIELELNHPITNEQLLIKIDVPYKFNALLEREVKRWKKYN